MTDVSRWRRGVLAAVVLALAATAAAPADEATIQPPVITVLQHSPTDAPGLVFLAPKHQADVTGSQGAEIVDDLGRPIWFRQAENGQIFDFRSQRFQGRRVLTWFEGINGESPSNTDFIADDHYNVIARVRAGNGLTADLHEFLLTRRGSALITIYHTIPFDLSPVGGPVHGFVVDGVVQEIDVATGRVLFEWHSLGHVPLSDSFRSLPATPEEAWDYFHLNAVHLAANGDLLISARHTWTVYDIDRRTGDIKWQLGGKRSDFALGPGVQFAWQHDPNMAGPHLIRLFDNATSTLPGPPSRVIWIRLNAAAHTATLVRAIKHPGGNLIAASQGNAQALKGDHTFVGWGATGRVSEFDAAGALLFDARPPEGYDTYRAYRFRWNGHPDTPPTLTATAGSGSATLHAIWNGATGVASWRILGGASQGTLAPVTTVPWNGLDTAVQVPRDVRFAEAVALNAAGNAIAHSAVIAIG